MRGKVKPVECQCDDRFTCRVCLTAGALIAPAVHQAPDYGVCQWFAKCGRTATNKTPHPILGEVPTCLRCHKFATGS